MKFMSKPTLILLQSLCLSLTLSAQKPADMAGTWKGMATLEGMADANELVLVLEMKEGTLAGHMTDQFGTMSESPIEEVKLEGGVFSFSVRGMGPGGQEITLDFKMNVDGDSMKGTFGIADMGMAGAWEATRQD